MGLISSGKAQNITGLGLTVTGSITLTAGSNRKVVVQPLMGQVTSGVECTGVTCGGVALTRCTDAYAIMTNGTTGTVAADNWFLDDADFPADGAQDIVATFDAVATALIIFFHELHDVAQGQPEDANAAGMDPQNICSAAVTTLTDGALILSAAICNGNRASATYGTGQSALQNYLNQQPSAVGTEETKATAGADTQSVTWPSPDLARSVITVVVIGPFVAGAALPPKAVVRGMSQAVHRAAHY